MNIQSCWFAALCLAISLNGAAIANTVESTCQEIRVAGPDSYVPFVWFREADQQVMGAGVEITRRALAKHNITLKVERTFAWNRTLARAAVGEIDILVALYKTEERTKVMDFIGPYASERALVLTRSVLDLDVTSLADLNGLYGGAAQGDSRGDALEERMRQDLTLIRAPHVRLLFAMLIAGRLDYMLLGESAGLYRDDIDVRSHAAMRPHILPGFEQGIYLGVSKRSPCAPVLTEILAQEVPAMVSDGTANQLLEYYIKKFKEGHVPQTPMSDPIILPRVTER